MGLRMWKKILAVAHPAGQRSRQQIWPSALLTRRQKRVFGRLNRVYSAELRRSTGISPIQKLVTAKKQKVWNSSLAKTQLGSLVVSKNNYSPCYKGVTRVNSPWWNMNTPGLQNNWRTAHIKSSLAVMRARITRPLWIYKNPAAVPGVVKVRKANWLFGRQLRAAQSLNSWLGRVQARNIIALLQRAWTKKGGIVWNWAIAMEAQWPVLLVKAGFQTTTPGARHLVKYGQVSKNGAVSLRAPAVAQPADVISVNTKALSLVVTKVVDHKYTTLPQLLRNIRV